MTRLSERYAVAAQIGPDDVADLASAGFVAVICNRPDHEEPAQPTAGELSAACVQAGIEFHHIPVTTPPFPENAVEAHRQVLDACDGPVLGYCRSGARSRMIWESS